MTNYVPCYASDFSRRELLALADAMNTDVRQAVCAWLQLNLWMQDNAPTGSVAGMSPGTIAVGAGLPANQGVRLLDSLAMAGLVDHDGQLTDWHLYGGRLLDSRERKAESMRKARSRPPNGGTHVDPTRRQPSGNADATKRPRFAKEEVKLNGPSDRKESASQIQSPAGGGESRAPTHEDYAWVNALVPGAITAAADAQRFQDVFDSRPDIDHTYELRTMFVKMTKPSRGRSWAQQYASWIRDGKSHKLLPAHQRPQPAEVRDISDAEYQRIHEFGAADDAEFQAARRYQHVHRLDS